ncbi:MAG: hypothetical protein HGA59_08460 [Chlorobiaceae bacterium]|nr:hypothetical protein [Chlorobiaceae bacterium]NTV15875.1 hypothetical protein [Chlorobiaceae bacterium]
MTRLLRILFALLLLLALLPASAWFLFPWYAQSMADRALEGKPFHIEISGAGLPGFSGASFRKIKVTFTTPPDGCGDAATYSLSLADVLLSWHFKNNNTPGAGTFLPNVLNATFTIEADSLNLKPETEEFAFSDLKPEITANIDISRNQAFKLSFRPLLATYPIDSAIVTREKLRLEGVRFNVRLSAENKWQQPLDTLHVAKLFSDGNQSPVGNFKALFSSKRNPLNPCTITLTDCLVELFHWKASTESIEYDLKEKSSRFSLRLAEIPLAELPGFKGSSSTPFATGRISGLIPVEFQDSTVNVRNAVIMAGKDTRLLFYNKEQKPWLSLDFGIGEVAKNLNASVILNSRNKKLSGLAMSDLSASVLGGTVTSTPVSFDPSANTTRLTLRLNRINALDRVRLHGDFKGSLNGTISGTIPLVIAKKGFSIHNAHIQSPGGGRVTFAPPSIQKSAQERIFGTQKPDADYTFSEPDLVLNRSLNGTATISFNLKKLLRKTDGGEMLLLSPKGTLMLGHNRTNMNTVALSDFSAGFLDGTVAIGHIDYDMAKKEGETMLQVNNIPLQKLLDMQGTKKIYATGNLRGNIPVKMKNDVFEIRDGGMNAEQSGQIIYATTPEERAAANQGLRTTYEALSNFLYVHLVSSINMAPDGKSIITIQLKGTNPDFQNGRPIELNLNVEQNLLDLMRSLSISTNVEQVISEKALQLQKK